MHLKKEEEKRENIASENHCGQLSQVFSTTAYSFGKLGDKPPKHLPDTLKTQDMMLNTQMAKISIKSSPISITPASEGHAEIIAAIELKLVSLTSNENIHRGGGTNLIIYNMFVACQCKRNHNHHNNYHGDDNDNDNDEYDETL